MTRVDYDVSEIRRAASLFVAVVERQAVTSVLRGENAGKTLRHENVVRSLVFTLLTAATGSVVVPVPLSLARPGAEMIAWVEEAPGSPEGMQVLGAARSPIADPLTTPYLC